MSKVMDFIHQVEVSGCKTFDDFTAALSAVMREKGIPHSAAQRDENGFCLTCGKKILCPGVHTFEEIQHANRLQVAAAHGTMTGTRATA